MSSHFSLDLLALAAHKRVMAVTRNAVGTVSAGIAVGNGVVAEVAQTVIGSQEVGLLAESAKRVIDAVEAPRNDGTVLASVVGQMVVPILAGQAVQLAEAECASLDVVGAVVALRVGVVEEEVGHAVEAAGGRADGAAWEGVGAQVALVGRCQVKTRGTLSADCR